MGCSYASLLERFDTEDFSLAVSSSGTTTQATGFYYFACGLVRGGINLLTSLGQVNVSAGQKLRFTVNSSARPTGLDPFALILGAAATNNATNAKVLAVLWVKEADQVSDRALPAYIDLTSDEDFVLEGEVDELADLPTSPVNGAIRYVASESEFYQYDEEGWHPNTGGDPGWIAVGGWDLYLSGTVTLRWGTLFKGGCDVPLDSFSDTETSDYWGIIPAPVWSSEGSPSPSIKVWLTNRLSEGAGNVVPISSQIAFRPAVNGSEELGSLLLSGKTQITPTKRIRRLDGSSTALSNSAIAWVAGNPFYSNPADLNPGYALEFSVVTTAHVGAGDRVSFIVYDYGLIGKSDNNEAIGTAIFATPIKKARIVPDTLGIKRLPGAGWIDTQDQLGGYSFYATNELTITYGIEEDTADQQVCIAGSTNGGIVVRQNGDDLLATEALRAIISTEPGTATASGWTNAVSISTNGQLSVLIDLPSAIRSNYPDTRIASNSDAERQIPFLLPYVRVGGVIKRGLAIAVGVGPTQTVIVSTVSTWTTVGSLPSNADAEFNLWGYGTATASAGGGTGSLSSGSYEFAYAWYYPTPNAAITKISHDPADGCINEFAISFADALDRMQYAGVVSSNDTLPGPLEDKIPASSEVLVSVGNEGGDESLVLTPKYWRSPAATKSALKAIPIASIAGFEGRIVGENLAAYTFDPNSAIADDGEDVLEPDDATGDGRWRKISGSGSGGISSVADVAALKAIPTSGLADNSFYGIRSTNNLYRYSAASTATGDDNLVITPNTSTGRWLKQGRINADEVSVSGTTNKFVTAADVIKLGNVPSNTGTAIAAKENDLGLPGANGYYLSSTTGGTRSWVAGPSDGWNAYATSSQAIAVPSVGSTVTVTLNTGTTTGMAVGQYWTLSDGSFSVNFQVQSIGSVTQVTFLNPSSEGNATGTLNSGATTNGVKLVVGGKKGATGNAGAVTAASSLVFDSAIAPPTTGSSERAVFINSSDFNRLSQREPSSGTTRPIPDAIFSMMWTI